MRFQLYLAEHRGSHLRCRAGGGLEDGAMGVDATVIRCDKRAAKPLEPALAKAGRQSGLSAGACIGAEQAVIGPAGSGAAGCIGAMREDY